MKICSRQTFQIEALDCPDLGKNRKPIFKRATFSYLVALMDERQNQLDFDLAADDLLEFPRDLGEEGWFQFLSEQKLAFQRVEEKFHIVLNRRVRLRLRGWDEEFTGKLVLNSLVLPAPTAETIQLRLGSVTFENTDIEYFKTLD
ncbi:hypothetical protein P4C99_12860 [Pontiellaceae bacterium B1224]|nr:hypothetical protein [Pontiellaceae bacterium B1224]